MPDRTYVVPPSLRRYLVPYLQACDGWRLTHSGRMALFRLLLSPRDPLLGIVPFEAGSQP